MIVIGGLLFFVGLIGWWINTEDMLSDSWLPLFSTLGGVGLALLLLRLAMGSSK